MTDDPATHESMLRHVLRLASELDLSTPPPLVGQLIHRRLREVSGDRDPYREVKSRYNQMALELLPALRERVEASDRPLWTAARLAIAGNVIDLGVPGHPGQTDVVQALDRVWAEPFEARWEEFEAAVSRAGRILYLADNAGEIVFDRLLIEQLGPERVTVAVRGGPIINDATMEDAVEAGLTGFVEVVDNGSDAPGTILDQCSEGFVERFRQADLVIAKGQGNFETLSDEPARLFFLFKVKCQVVSEHVGLPVGTHVLIPSVG